MTPLSLLGLGFVLGLRHALDADHLAAVATLVGQGQPFSRAARIGVLWGLGHTAALLAAALLMVVFRIQVPESVAAWFELGVAALLLILALRLVASILRGDRLDLDPHSHGGHRHTHPHLHPRSDAGSPTVPVLASTVLASTVLADPALVHPAGASPGPHADHGPAAGGVRPFLIGILHGLAGSAALLLLTLTTVSEPLSALLFVLIFGVGSIGGMLAMSSALSLPLIAAGRRSLPLFRAVQILIVLGTVWVSVGMIREFAAG